MATIALGLAFFFVGFVVVIWSSWLLPEPGRGFFQRVGLGLMVLGPLAYWLVLPVYRRWWGRRRLLALLVLVPAVTFSLVFLLALVLPEPEEKAAEVSRTASAPDASPAALPKQHTVPLPATPSPPPATPSPPTASEAIALVRASEQMSRQVAPFRREVEWAAEWMGDRWWVIGAFESPWGVTFVADATIWESKVYAYISYGMRPKREWVEAKARAWGLTSLYTRLTPGDALALVKKSSRVAGQLRGLQVMDEVAELVEDTAASVAWRFAFYVQKGGQNIVLVVDGLGGRGAKEGNYAGGYGFGEAVEIYQEVPLHLVDWVRGVASARGWKRVANLP